MADLQNCLFFKNKNHLQQMKNLIINTWNGEGYSEEYHNNVKVQEGEKLEILTDIWKNFVAESTNVTESTFNSDENIISYTYLDDDSGAVKILSEHEVPTDTYGIELQPLINHYILHTKQSFEDRQTELLEAVGVENMDETDLSFYDADDICSRMLVLDWNKTIL